ncbi:MAG: VIT and VWA domain-containing protein [Candidatus Wallbacteria bacterium]|nr:VIT and VWA domain-containing protein [Candidatus Wallbacteria bacterium]
MKRIFILLLLFTSIFCHADGIIVIPDRIDTEPPYLKLEKHLVDVRIVENHATTSVDEIFRNPTNRRIEGLYIFPLPVGASISEFSFEIGGVLQKGEILEREKARAIFEEIVRKIRDPALLEFYGQGLFKVSIFPIEPREEKRIVLKYNEILKGDARTFRYFYPLKIEHNAGDNIPLLRISLDVKQKRRIAGLYSPEFKLDRVDVKGGLKASFEARNFEATHDFTAYFTLGEELSSSLISYREGADDYFLLSIFPPDQSNVQAVTKEIIFALDTSGSMVGKKLDQARKALNFCLKSLKAADSFNLLTFATSVKAFSEKVLPADPENIKNSCEFLDKISSLGGTNISGALEQALNSFSKAELPHYLVFITDGEPTLELTEPGEILRKTKELNQIRSRIFTLGIGADLNSYLLDNLSSDNGGASDYLSEEEEMELKISSFYQKISSPVLTGISLSFKPSDVEHYPGAIPDLFAGSPMLLVGKCQKCSKLALVLNGRHGDEKFTGEYSWDLGGSDMEESFLPLLYAQRRVAYLLDQIRKNGSNRELIDEIKKLALKYGIVTPYTSFLVVEDQKFEREREVLQSRMDATGAGAVALSKSLNELWGGGIAGESRKEAEKIGIKAVGGRTFIKKGEFWQDTQYKEGLKEILIKVFSSEYFALIKENPSLAAFLSLGDKMILVVGEKAYRIE